MNDLEENYYCLIVSFEFYGCVFKKNIYNLTLP